MAAAVSTLWYVDSPVPAATLREFEPDRDAARALLTRLFPDRRADPLDCVPLTEAAGTLDGDEERICVGSYPGVTVVSSPRFALKQPSALPEMWLHTPAADRTLLLVSDPPGAWGAFAMWERGRLRRAFGANTVEFFEDRGLPFVWEGPYWGGEHPLRWPPNVTPPPASLPFHPRKLVEEAHAAWLGFRYVGRRDDEPDPAEFRVWRFALRAHDAPLPAPPVEPRPVSVTEPETVSEVTSVPEAGTAPEPRASWWRRLVRR
ncbi:hypothetical protein OED52_03850 [Rhodococcus sp. Z13]|uniref:Uncharacterized protein n=1 Tax=Rhodococcus sacchari TaxID=2962047 RepID=A0ACD4DIB9_9NOCA|nr:hypothetical protein [Rhodococcus sp. Z13]UYP19705.1 hypothetical protein OED52_03850 [Rhodococcus sp. Z13]